MHKTDHQYRINEIVSLIHQDISADLSASRLATLAAYSEAHFHRLFKKVIGESVHQYVRRTRLEAAANQLIFSQHQSVQRIAENCGFTSLSSFTHAFKSVYSVTPGAWRSGTNRKHKTDVLLNPEISAAYERLQANALPSPNIVNIAAIPVAYIRHKGYGRSIANSWETITAWANSQQRPTNIQLGLHHSNPALVPLEECHYVACIGIDTPVVRRGNINSAVIPGGLHAAFKLTGKYGELLPYISKILEQWLPQSGYLPRTTPAFAMYEKNQFLSIDEEFELTFYLPIDI